MGLFSAILEKLGVSHATAQVAPVPQPTRYAESRPHAHGSSTTGFNEGGRCSGQA